MSGPYVTAGLIGIFKRIAVHAKCKFVSFNTQKCETKTCDAHE